MSPAGGVGINLAIQDAVAAANRLAEPLATRTPTLRELAAVQERRLWPAKVIQAAQVFVHRRFINANVGGPVHVPSWLLAGMRAAPVLQRIPAYLVGVGPRPEHVQTPEASSALA
jgi:2-polyprenyl-6-methoxyphenol hydroxylase-like FAD-dependent oxidoreductase